MYALDPLPSSAAGPRVSEALLNPNHRGFIHPHWKQGKADTGGLCESLSVFDTLVSPANTSGSWPGSWKAVRRKPRSVRSSDHVAP